MEIQTQEIIDEKNIIDFEWCNSIEDATKKHQEIRKNVKTIVQKSIELGKYITEDMDNFSIREIESKTGISRMMISRYKKIYEYWLSINCQQLSHDGTLINKLLTDTQSNYINYFKVQERENNIQDIKQSIDNENKEIKDKYDVVILDPPWSYGRKYDPKGSRVANPYPEQTTDEIYQTCKNMFKDDCVLWLWTTHQFIWDAKTLIDKWGFEYKATLVWNKEKMGMGNWLRMQCEFCLLAIKGKPYYENTKHRDIINESRREHSRKPLKFYDVVKETCHGVIYQYYSREKIDGIISEGIENEKF